jgi:tetratricopeptide (TPR) repeat protein
MRDLLAELRRRRVFRVAAVYAGVAFVVWQAADIAFPALQLPDWMVTAVVALTILGFPIALVLAWAFEITPEGVRRTEPALSDAAAAAMPAAPLGARHTAGVVGAGILIGLVTVGAYTGLRSPASPFRGEVSATSVAVLPFAVRGGPELAYLREGMVNLLAAKLDGAGELRSIDAHTLLTVAGERGQWNPQQAAEVAGQVGAGLFIVGSVVESAGQLHLEAALHEVSGTEPLARAFVEGRAGELFALVDRLAVELLSARMRRAEAGLGRAAELITPSLPALRAFLEGESARRNFDIDRAVEAYQRAIREDSAFALAHLRLVSVVGWGGGRHLPLRTPALEAALRHRERLSARERLFLAAEEALQENPAATERSFREILARYPGDFQALYQLGEAIFHGNPYRGRSSAEARPYLEQALALDPTNREVLFHLLDIAVEERRYGDLAAMLGDPVPGENARFRLLRALAHYAQTGPAGRARLLEEIRELEPWAQTDLLSFALIGGPAEAVAEVVEMTGRTLRPGDREQAFAAGLRATMTGQFVEVRRIREQLSRQDLPGPAMGLGLQLYLAPHGPASRQEIARLRDELLAVKPEDLEVPEVDVPKFEIERLRLVALLDLRLGDLAAVRRHAEQLDGVPARSAKGPVARFAARSLRAAAAHVEGRPAEALRLLEEAREEMFGLALRSDGMGWQLSPERFRIAELLREMGRDEEALAWYAPFKYDDATYFPMAHLRLGEIHERLGNRTEAAWHYAQLAALWKDADPELRPLAERAERRLAALR